MTAYYVFHRPQSILFRTLYKFLPASLSREAGLF